MVMIDTKASRLTCGPLAKTALATLLVVYELVVTWLHAIDIRVTVRLCARLIGGNLSAMVRDASRAWVWRWTDLGFWNVVYSDTIISRLNRACLTYVDSVSALHTISSRVTTLERCSVRQICG